MLTATPERATLTVDETAAVLGIGRELAFTMCRTGQIPTIRLGRRILVPRAALERMLETAGQSDGISDDAA